MYREYLPWHIKDTQRQVTIKNRANKKILDEKITLLNWNVHKNNHSLEWLQDFSKILNSYDPSIILFQEYQKMNHQSILDKRDEYGYGFFPNFMWKDNLYGLINAAKGDIIDYNAYTTKEVEPIIKTPKITLQTKYTLQNGKSLYVTNVHMINFVKIKKFLKQIEQIEELSLSCDDAMILCGDFNTWNKKRMTILEKLIYKCGFEAVKFEDNKHLKQPFPFPLDHVFFKGLTFKNSQVIHEINSSDHKPMLIEFLAK